MIKKKKPNSVDAYVGSRVRSRRLMLNISQEKLGDALGLTFQQVQKYEKGTNRIGSSRLQQISNALQVPVSFFFEGVPSVAGDKNSAKLPPIQNFVSEFLATTDGLHLVRAFSRISNPKIRRSIVALVEQVALENG